MALTQDDRIAISKKLVAIPQQNQAAENNKAQLEVARLEAEKADNANKALQADPTALINLYQQELNRYDGNGRTEVTEQDMLDSVNRILQNPFFPNDLNTPLPNVPDGAWKNFVPFSGNKAIGRNYDETFTTVTKEQDLIDAVNSAIAAVEAFSDATRSTGETCSLGGTCSLPIYTDQTSCTDNGGTWTPSPPDNIDPDPAMQAAGDALKTAIQNWEDFLNGTDAVVPTTDTNPTRSAENIASKDDIANAIGVIDTWQALDDYDTTTSLPTTCAAFNALTAGDFTASKFRSTELQAIKNEITARQAFISTRTGQISGHLGTVNQDFTSGELLGGSGFYYQRFLIIDMRLNAIAGTLGALKGLENGQKAQQEFQNSNNNASTALSLVMYASAFRSPGTNITSVHVLDASGFAPSDLVYIVSDTQAEIAATIVSIDGNRLVLDTAIPEKYRHTEGARVYKLL